MTLRVWLDRLRMPGGATLAGRGCLEPADSAYPVQRRKLRVRYHPSIAPKYCESVRIPYRRQRSAVNSVALAPNYSVLVTHTTGRVGSMGYLRTQSCCVCQALHF